VPRDLGLQSGRGLEIQNAYWENHGGAFDLYGGALMKSRFVKSTRLIICGLFAYACGYVVTVRRGFPGSVIAGPRDRISCPAVYYYDSEWMGYLFRPANMVDRLVRHNFWNPIVRDLVEEATRSGKFKTEYEASDRYNEEPTGSGREKLNPPPEAPAPR